MQDVNHQLFSDSVYGECEQTGKDKKEEIDRLLEDFDLLDMKERHPMSLSGGQKQRLAIVTAILSEKRILVSTNRQADWITGICAKYLPL